MGPEREVIGVLHPGEMGVFVAASARISGNEVYWASEGRSEKTTSRAAERKLLDAISIERMCELCTIIISVCPPHAAEDVANQVLLTGYRGLYVDANAISPQRVIRMGDVMEDIGITFVDGGIVGGPDWEGGRTNLYLSGKSSNRVAMCFVDSPLQTIDLQGNIGKSSATKMCYAAYTKGTTALISSILAASEYFEVREWLMDQWAHDWPGFDEQAERRATRVTAKAWRFSGEMEEISATFQEAGLPGGFHAGAAEIYRRLGKFKDADSIPDLNEVLGALLGSSRI